MAEALVIEDEASGFDDPEEEEEEWDDEGEFDEGLSSTAAASRCTSRHGPGAVGDRSMSVMAKLLSRSNASGWEPVPHAHELEVQRGEQMEVVGQGHRDDAWRVPERISQAAAESTAPHGPTAEDLTQYEKDGFVHPPFAGFVSVSA